MSVPKSVPQTRSYPYSRGEPAYKQKPGYLPTPFALFLEAWCASHQLTVRAAATKLQVETVTVRKWLSGERTAPRARHVLRNVAAGTGRPLAEIERLVRQSRYAALGRTVIPAASPPAPPPLPQATLDVAEARATEAFARRLLSGLSEEQQQAIVRYVQSDYLQRGAIASADPVGPGQRVGG